MKKVWLDLEDTIINSWNEGVLINPIKIKKWLDDRDVTEIHIWSFAIWDDADKEKFVTSKMKEMIETALNRPIISYPSVEEVQKLIYEHEKILYDSRHEFMQLHGKKWSFIKYCLGHEKDNECYLIDDAVPNLIIKEQDLNLEINLINVASLKWFYPV